MRRPDRVLCEAHVDAVETRPPLNHASSSLQTIGEWIDRKTSVRSSLPTSTSSQLKCASSRTAPYTSSSSAISVASDFRGPSFRIRV
jgi:hypothetical protein